MGSLWPSPSCWPKPRILLCPLCWNTSGMGTGVHFAVPVDPRTAAVMGSSSLIYRAPFCFPPHLALRLGLSSGHKQIDVHSVFHAAFLYVLEVTMSLRRFFFSRLNIPVPINLSLLTGACGLHPAHRCVLFGLWFEKYWTSCQGLKIRAFHWNVWSSGSSWKLEAVAVVPALVVLPGP